MVRYNYEYLVNFCKENNIELRKDYSDINVTKQTIIIAKCIRCNKYMIEKILSYLVESKNFGCIDCFPIIKKERIIQTNLEKYGCENPFQNEEVKQKIINSNLEKYGCKNPMQNQDVKQKTKDTCLALYGAEHPFHNEEVQQKIKDTFLLNYGFENPFQNEEIKQKIKETNLEKYGVEYTFQNEEIKQKCKDTCLLKYGYESAMQNDDIKQKGKDTSILRYGYPYPMQNSEYAEKVSKTAYKNKNYTFPSGRIDIIQGYENYGLSDLLNIEHVIESDIITSRSEVPVIWWTDTEGNKHRYFIDIFIASQNRGIEIKSTWTMEKKNDITLLKQKAFIDAGYLCDIWVYKEKGIRVMIC